MSANDFLTSQGLPDGELLGVVLLVMAPLGLIVLLHHLHDRRNARRLTVATPEVEVSAYGPCNAHRPHQYRLTADGTAHVCVHCQERVERGTPRRDDLPYDQATDIRNDDWQAWGDELRRRSA